MLEKIEENINKCKRKIDHRTWGIIAYAMFGIAILYGMQMANMFKREKQIAEDNYNKSMYELVNYVQNVEVLISKARITTTPVESCKTYADIWRQANLAKDQGLRAVLFLPLLCSLCYKRFALCFQQKRPVWPTIRPASQSPIGYNAYLQRGE